MKIYKILKTKKESGFFGDYDKSVIDYWSINPVEESLILKQDEKIENDILYSIEYDLDKVKFDELMSCMKEYMSIEVIKFICEHDKFIEKLFMASISSLFKSEELLEEIEKAKSSASSATGLATLGLFL